MELKQFVLEALVQISEGVKEAEEVGAGARFYASPDKNTAKAGGLPGERGPLVVSFDIAVGVAADESRPDSEKLSVLSAAAGNGASLGQAVSRISFSVPLHWRGKSGKTELDSGKRPAQGIPDLDISL